MAQFAEKQWFEVIDCCACGMAFGMPLDVYRRRKDDHKTFYCPAGHQQHFTGPSEAQRLRKELDGSAQKLLAAELREEAAKRDLKTITKAHQRMRYRVMNGVCPCCNRSFLNLREHMKTQHSDFGNVRTLKALREAFGMTQAAVATEASVQTAYVSLYERDKPVPGAARLRLERWLNAHGAIA